jgi:hypothetical protein
VSTTRFSAQFFEVSTTMFRRRSLFILLLAGALLPGGASLSAAQETPVPAQDTAPPAPDDQGPTVNARDARRACDGCPPRRIGMSLLHTTGINVMYELANLARGQVTAHITPKTWWTNMQQGMVWDLDDFAVNQIGHPYQGNNYFNAGRANGLSFY